MPEPQHLQAPVGGDPGGHYDNLGGDPRSLAVAGTADAGLAVGGNTYGNVVADSDRSGEGGHLGI
jgi:hypothetical protein